MIAGVFCAGRAQPCGAKFRKQLSRAATHSPSDGPGSFARAASAKHTRTLTEREPREQSSGVAVLVTEGRPNPLGNRDYRSGGVCTNSRSVSVCCSPVNDRRRAQSLSGTRARPQGDTVMRNRPVSIAAPVPEQRVKPDERMDVEVTPHGTVLIFCDSWTAAALAGRENFRDVAATQRKLERAICEAWYDADCPPVAS